MKRYLCVKSPTCVSSVSSTSKGVVHQWLKFVGEHEVAAIKGKGVLEGERRTAKSNLLLHDFARIRSVIRVVGRGSLA